MQKCKVMSWIQSYEKRQKKVYKRSKKVNKPKRSNILEPMSTKTKLALTTLNTLKSLISGAVDSRL